MSTCKGKLLLPKEADSFLIESSSFRKRAGVLDSKQAVREVVSPEKKGPEKGLYCIT